MPKMGHVSSQCSNMSSTCPDNKANFGPLAAEIDPVVWGTPTNFKRFCVLLWSPYVTGQTIIFLPGDFYLSSFFLSLPNLSGRRLDVYHTPTAEIRREKKERKKERQKSPGKNIMVCPITQGDHNNQKAPQGGCGHRRQHARLRLLSEVQKPRDLDLDLGSG